MKSLNDYLTLNEQSSNEYYNLNTALVNAVRALRNFDDAASKIGDDDSFWVIGPDDSPDVFAVIEDLRGVVARLNNNNPSLSDISEFILSYTKSQYSDEDDAEQ